MDQLSITIKVTEPEVLSGEELWVVVQLSNNGDQPASISDPNAAAARPVLYRMATDDGVPMYQMSQGAFRANRVSRGRTPLAIEPEELILGPGESVTFDEEIAKFADTPFAPGRYELDAVHTESGATSAAVELMVTLPSIYCLAALMCPVRQEAALVLSHGHQDGSISILQKDAFQSGPHSGTFQRRLSFPAGQGGADQLAVACIAEGYGVGRWFAWLHQGALSAARGAGSCLTAATAAPQPVGLKRAQLVSPGFQLDGEDGQGLFLVHGRAGNDTMLRQLSVTRERTRLSPPVKLCSGRVDRVVARFEAQGAQWRTHLVYTTAAAVYTCSLDHEGRRLGTPTMVHQHPELQLYCLELFPLGANLDAMVHLLYGPREDLQGMAYIRAPMIQGAIPLEEWTLDAPAEEGFVGCPCAIADQEGGQLPVVAQVDDRLVWAAAMGGQWQVLLEHLPPLGYLHLLASRGDFWVGWYDPIHGIAYIGPLGTEAA